MKHYEKLGQLTALRFVAAAMVVVCHMGGLFGFSADPGLDGLLTGVSFFFVLSGFILAYVYPQLRTRGEVSSFLRARVARIWPGHVATFLLAVWLLRLPWDGPVALPNLLLVQAWNPLAPESFYFSYNSPSWSLSTELFFYLAFPYLISDWNRKWPIRVSLSAAVLAAIIAYVNFLGLPDGGPSFVYVNPASRIFEFIFGMLLHSVWQRYRGRVNWSFALATTLEIIAIGTCALSVYFVPGLAERLGSAWTGPGFSTWLYGSGSMFAYGLVILVMAMGRGGVSRFLARQWCVLLGEISFSVFLLHQIFLRFYLENFVFFPKLPDGIAFLFFWIFLLLSSYVMWSWLEMPARRVIVQWQTPRWLIDRWRRRRWFTTRLQPRRGSQRPAEVSGDAKVRRTWRERLVLHRVPIVAGLVLVCMVLVLRHAYEGIRTTVPVVGSAESKARNSALMGRLKSSIKAGDVEVVRWLLESGVDPNSPSSAGYPPLVQASEQGAKEVVELLLAKNADPNLRSRDGITPLVAAAIHGQSGIVRRLAKAGGDINVRSKDGSTPLIYAASRGNLTVVKALLALGADSNATRSDGYTALMGAAMHGNTEIVSALVRKGATVDGRAKDGTTPLMIAAQNGSRDLVNTLLTLGANPNVSKAGGYTALVGAALQGDPDIVRVLVGKGANVDGGAEGDTTPLMVAAWKGDRAVVDVLLSFGANTDAMQADGLTALMMASMAGHGEIVAALARSGAKVNVVNAKGATPLMVAAWAGKQDLVELLVSMGADLNASNKDGYTAIDLARMGKHPEIAAFLLNKLPKRDGKVPRSP